MSTELLGIIIITGSMLAFALKYHQKQREDAKELTMSAKKLRRELEETADGIIQRMETNIDYLEQLLLETETHATELKRQIEIIREFQEQAMYAPPLRVSSEDFLSNQSVIKAEYSPNQRASEEDYAPNQQVIKEEYAPNQSLYEESYSHSQGASKEEHSSLQRMYEEEYPPHQQHGEYYSLNKSAVQEDFAPNERAYEEKYSPSQIVYEGEYPSNQQDMEEAFSKPKGDKFSSILEETLAKNEATLPTIETNPSEDDFKDELYLAQQAVASVRNSEEQDAILPSVDSLAREDVFLQEEASEIPLANEYLEESLAKKEAKKLLEEGYSTAEISKKVHLGEGAIELLRQIEEKRSR